ncbi:uncharacterized protein [Nicotiana tomentosiformis]|uniref:uncharacterized protein n=1 Tax=Nicotiana tomentosiformis TaxID=4098 RepID=UPI00388C7874
MSTNITLAVRKSEKSYPYPNTLTEYFNDAKVEPRPYDTKVKAKKPFSWYHLQGANNPKFKGKVTTTVSQSDEPSGVGSEAAAEPSTALMPSTAAGPSTGKAEMPPSSSSRPSVAVPVQASSTYPLTALRVSHTLASLNSWMQTTISKLSDISSTVAAQSSTPAAPQVPSSVEETLKKILDNQKTVMDTLVAHGGAIEELTKQVKKMRKSQDSKKAVDSLIKEVKKIAAAGDFPFDLLMETDPSVPADPTAPSAEAPAGQSDEPDLTAPTDEEMLQILTNPIVPQPSDDEIQLEETEGDDAASHPETT